MNERKDRWRAMKKHSKTLSNVSKQLMIEKGMNMVAGLDIGDRSVGVWCIST